MPGPKSLVFTFADVEVHDGEPRIRRNGDVLPIEPKAFRVLLHLLRNPGRLIPKDELITAGWGDTAVTDNSLTRNIALLRRLLEDDAREPRFIETVSTAGYRFICPVTMGEGALSAVASTDRPNGQTSNGPVEVFPRSVSDGKAAATENPPEPETPSEMPPGKPAQKSPPASPTTRLWVPLTAALCVCFLLAAWLVFRQRTRDAAEPRIASLAVLPLKNLSGNPAQDYLADGLTEEVIGRLAMIRGLRVISRTSVMQFKDTKLLTPEIAKTLGVDAIVEGSVIREGNQIRVHAQLLRASSDEHFWSETYDRELGDALTLESEVAQSIARRVEVTVTGEEHARLLAARPVSPAVYVAYLKGLTAPEKTPAEAEQRIAYFNEAISEDPTFAPAYVGLADAYSVLGTMLVGGSPSETRPKVISNARRALELNPELAQAHFELAEMDESLWRWADSENEYRRALELNPNLAEAHFGFSDWLLCHGRFDEALAWARRGRELDPVGSAGKMVYRLLHARRYDEAIQEARNLLAVKPEDAEVSWYLGSALIFSHHPEEAIPVLEKAASITNRSPGVICMLVWAYARAGRRTDAVRLVEELKRRQRSGYIPPGAFLYSYLALGDKEEAFVWLERARQEQSNNLKYVKIFPAFDEVRADPRFQDVVRRIGLN
jgi:TolB-like protein/DNA-binding winged helix-turn-helix (wHTH) protein